MSGALLKQWLRRTGANLRREVFLHMGAVASLTAAFVLLGLVGLVHVNVEEAVTTWSRDLAIVGYLRDRVSEAEAKADLEKVRRIEGVRAVRWVSSEEAQRRMAQGGTPAALAFAGLPADLFPASFEIDLRAEARTVAAVERIRTALLHLPAIDEVDAGLERAGRVGQVRRLVRVAGLVVLVVVALAVLSIVSSTLLVTLHRRRDEIELLRLYGATDTFLRMPILLEGVFQSGAGVLVALLVLGALFAVLRSAMAPTLSVWASTLQFLPGSMLLGGALLFLVLGAVGSVLSFRKALRV